MKYAWITQYRSDFSVETMCRFMQVSRSAYYEWLHRMPTQAEKEDAELTTQIQDVFKKSRATLWDATHQEIVVTP